MINLNNLFKNEYIQLQKNYNIRIFSKKTKWIFLWKLLDIFSFLIITKKDTRKISQRYVTCIGPFIFFTSEFDINNINIDNYLTLKHEEVHIKWYLNLGLGSIWLGFFLFCILYIFCFLPIGLAYFRYAAERAAYVITYKEAKKLGYNCNINYLISYLTGSTYLWAWPFKRNVRNYFYKKCL